jgi:tetratricopeptide (TPR) repeat protein
MQHRITIENEAKKYEQKGEYGLAINEYLKILDIYGKEISQGSIRSKLSECYEKIGQYEAALKEIDWLLERKVLATPELLERKKRIQELH